MSDELDLRLLRGQMGGCTCGTKTPKLGAHDPQCKYRLCAEAATTIAALRAELAAKEVEIARLRLRLEWKPISTYQQPTYAGYTPKVVVGRMWRGPDGRSEMPWPLGVAWFDEGCGKWIDVADKKPWPEEPTLWLCEVTGQPVAALKEPPHAQ